MAAPLIGTLPDGPLDVIGDVHGEIELLHELLNRLGYAESGIHPDDRRLVFVGDLVDRGPDSIAVARWVMRLIESGQAQCVLGNHELNIVLGLRKHGNLWFHGEHESLAGSDDVTPAQLADDATRNELLTFFATFPLALVRPDLRVVHASWSNWAVNQLGEQTVALDTYRKYRRQIQAELDEQGITDEVERELRLQNANPVKLLTSGPEQRAAQTFYSSGRERKAERVKWWDDYANSATVVFGHYSNFHTAGFSAPSGVCVDYAAARRWEERLNGRKDGDFETGIGALRWPERQVVVQR